MLKFFSSRATRREGASMVILVIIMPLFVLSLSMALDFGHWVERQRHLQMQVDAGALAAGTVMSACFLGPPEEAPGRIFNMARLYAGDPEIEGSFNRQSGGGDSVVLAVNAEYPNEDGSEANPCVSRQTYVNAIDRNLPWYFNAFGNDRFDIKATARVEIREIQSTTGLLPWAVPDIEPHVTAVLLVDDASGQVVRSVQLSKVGVQYLNAFRMLRWDNSGDLANLSLSPGGYRLVVLLSAIPNPTLSGSIATVCAQLNVRCAGENDGVNGIGFLRVFEEGGGTASAPVLEAFELRPLNCEEDSSAPMFYLNVPEGGCRLAVRARLNFGGDAPPGTSIAVQGGECPTSGSDPKGCRLVYQGPGSPDAGWWITTSDVPTVRPDAGPVALHLAWKAGTGSQAPSGVFATAARPRAANAASDPVLYFEAQKDGFSRLHYLTAGAHSLRFVVGLKQGLVYAKRGDDPAVVLRFSAEAGSQNQAVDCDERIRFELEIYYGCRTPYSKNTTGMPCPNAVRPLNCVLIETGDKIGQIRSALEDRWTRPSCAPNNWIVDPQNPARMPRIPENDPRIVQIFVSDYASFKGQGNGWIPVREIASFYLTGWDDQGRRKCADNEPFPGPGTKPHGSVWGHFIKFVVPSSRARASDELCVLDSISTCVATLIR